MPSAYKASQRKNLSDGRFDSYLWILPLLLFFVLWEALAQLAVIPSNKVPSFSKVVIALCSCATQIDFLHKVFQSFANLTAGIFLAFSIALPLALFAGLRNKFDKALTPLVMLVGSLPDLAILPLVVVWFGPGNAAAIGMATVCAFFPIYFTVREGTKEIPLDYFHVTTIFGSTKFDMFKKMMFPVIFPFMITGLRISYDFVWEVILAIEIIARVTGIGTFVDVAVAAGSIEYAFAGIMAVGIIALAVDRVVFGALEGWIRRWKE